MHKINMLRVHPRSHMHMLYVLVRVYLLLVLCIVQGTAYEYNIPGTIHNAQARGIVHQWWRGMVNSRPAISP